MYPDSGHLRLQVWYGALLTPVTGGTARHPALPGWAEDMLGDGDGAADMEKAIPVGGYTRGAITWIAPAGSGPRYYGIAAAESVQSAQTAGEVSTCFPEEQMDAWAADIALVLDILGLQAAAMAWYQTAVIAP